MAFPTIEATNGGNSGGNATSHTINLPSGIAAGDLLLVFFCTDGNPTITWPASPGWTNLWEGNCGTGTAAKISCRYRVADGTEGSTITIATSASETSAHNTYRIRGHDTTSKGITIGTAAVGLTQYPDPPNCNPGTAKDYLWFAISGNDSRVYPTVWPTNYTLSRLSNYYDASTAAQIASAGQNLNASAENPGQYTLSGSEDWNANTIAIHPGSEGLERKGEISFTEIEVPAAPRKGQISFTELEIPNAPRRGQISFSEFQIPNAPRQCLISFAETEIPTAPRQARLSFSEFEIPSPPSNDRTGQISFGELEVPIAPRKGQISFAEIEIPTAPRQGQISFGELEIPIAPRQARISFGEFEIPAAPRKGYISFAEMEIPSGPRQGQISFTELELPNAARQGQIAFAEFQTPTAPRQGQLSFAEMEVPNVNIDRQAQLSFSELETPAAPRQARVSFGELEIPGLDRDAEISFGELEVPEAPRAGQIAFAELQAPDGPRAANISFAELESPNAPRCIFVSFGEMEVPDDPVEYSTYGLPFLYETDNWVAVEFHLEVYLKADTGMAYARLYDETAGVPVLGSKLFTSEANLQRLRSGALSLEDGHIYRLQIGKIPGDAGEFIGGKLIAA